MSYPNSTSGGPPLRALAMVLIALAIVFAGLGAMSLSTSDADTETAEPPSSSAAAAPVTTTAERTTAASDTPSTPVAASVTTPAEVPVPAPAPAGVDRAVEVRVLNNSLVAGLASRTASELQAAGWTNVSPGNYSGGTLAKTTVYYGDSPVEREAAVQIARELGAVAEAKTTGVAASTPGVVVILTGT